MNLYPANYLLHDGSSPVVLDSFEACRARNVSTLKMAFPNCLHKGGKTLKLKVPQCIVSFVKHFMSHSIHAAAMPSRTGVLMGM